MPKQVLVIGPNTEIRRAPYEIPQPYFENVMSICDFPTELHMTIDGYLLEQFLKVIKITANENKITAIKFIRTLTNWGLKESKDFVEMLIENKDY